MQAQEGVTQQRLLRGLHGGLRQRWLCWSEGCAETWDRVRREREILSTTPGWLELSWLSWLEL
jgi:hypothetical protein